MQVYKEKQIAPTGALCIAFDLYKATICHKSLVLYCLEGKKPVATTDKWLLNSFTAKVALMHPKKIVQSKLRRRLSKAASELGLHYFLFHLAKIHKFTNINYLSYSFLSKIKYNIE